MGLKKLSWKFSVNQTKSAKRKAWLMSKKDVCRLGTKPYKTSDLPVRIH